MWHTLQEAINLTGRSRRSLYRDMDVGRVSYRVRNDGRREIETSELIRCYGSLRDWHSLAQAETQNLAQVGTPTLSDLLTEIQELKNQVQDLKEALYRLEYKPDPETPTPTPTPLSFADLLNQF